MERLTSRNPLTESEAMNLSLTDLYMRLKAYEDAEEQRRLAVLPFPIGTQIWSAEPFKDRKPRCAEVTAFEVDEDGVYGFWCGFDPEPLSAEFLIEDIGEVVFFTREEAEHALEG